MPDSWTLRVDDRTRFYAHALQRRFRAQLMLRVDDRQAIGIGTGSVIALPFMPSWLCNVRRKALEDWLTAVKCRPVRTDVTIPGSPSPRFASQDQNFIFTSPVAALVGWPTARDDN